MITGGEAQLKTTASYCFSLSLNGLQLNLRSCLGLNFVAYVRAKHSFSSWLGKRPLDLSLGEQIINVKNFSICCYNLLLWFALHLFYAVLRAFC